MCLWSPQLNSLDSERRRQALVHLSRRDGEPPFRRAVNLHLHTFYSFNAEHYSPAAIAWRARCEGLQVAGIVDFDVLDGLEEFMEAGRLLNLRVCAGIETRVHVPKFSGMVINSPGEPGIAYHMGAGMPQRSMGRGEERFLQALLHMAGQRNRELIDRVNRYLAPVEIDYDRDVLPMTPRGNATERHIARAYARRAADLYVVTADLKRFWSVKLENDVSDEDLPDSAWLLDHIRGRTMKRGGIGYVTPNGRSFPSMDSMNEFVLRAGGIPTLAWLNGESEGEQRMEEMVDAAMSAGVAAINIIPDRNFTPGVKDHKLENLHKVIALAEDRDWPVLVGTEMNAPGQKFVDDFESDELAPYLPLFVKSAHILYAHTILQRQHGRGYLSEWACRNFPDRRDRNQYFEEIGHATSPDKQDDLPAN